MIVFINGSFGVGKTTVAQGLLQVLPNALLFDPEEVGFMLRNVISPIEWTGDFQDYPMWRSLVVETATSLKSHYKRTLIMPMTVWRENYFRELLDGLTAIEPEFHHFCLTAPLDVIHERIRRRGDQPEGDWIFQQTSNCVQAFQSDLFAEHLDTSETAPSDLIRHIARRVGVSEFTDQPVVP